VTKIWLAFTALYREFIFALPDEFSKFRVAFYNRRGCKIDRLATFSPNVRLRGKVVIGADSSVAQNTGMSGANAGVFIGRDVMIAPNVIIVAFNHGIARNGTSMRGQPSAEAAVHIEDDVWVGAGAVIGKGVRIGQGAVIGANSFVNRVNPPYGIATGRSVEVVRRR
jgi:acetyltransferase-like isoleucine patch superfamily enzyme